MPGVTATSFYRELSHNAPLQTASTSGAVLAVSLGENIKTDERMLEGVRCVRLVGGVQAKSHVLMRCTPSVKELGRRYRTFQRHIEFMIFPVHEYDDWCVHGLFVKGAA